jgi:ABC-type multidrug transport system ATPase subunit
MLFSTNPTGLDPQVRLEIRDLIELRQVNDSDDHALHEAERLCDRVAVSITESLLPSDRHGVAGKARPNRASRFR